MINSLYIVPEDCEQHNIRLSQKYSVITKEEQRWEEYRLDDAKLVIVAFGTCARICKAVIDRAREEGLAVGLIRPITVWPFPNDVLSRVRETAEQFLSVEMNMGQMVEDVRLAVEGRKPVHFYGRVGGMMPVARDVLEEVKKLYNGGAV